MKGPDDMYDPKTCVHASWYGLGWPKNCAPVCRECGSPNPNYSPDEFHNADGTPSR